MSPVYRRNNRLRKVKSLVQIHRAANWLAKPQSRLHPQLGSAAPLPLGVCFPNPRVPGALEISSLLDNPQGLPRDTWPSALSPVAALAWAASDPGFWGQALVQETRLALRFLSTRGQVPRKLSSVLTLLLPRAGRGRAPWPLLGLSLLTCLAAWKEWVGSSCLCTGLCWGSSKQ